MVVDSSWRAQTAAICELLLYFDSQGISLQLATSNLSALKFPLFLLFLLVYWVLFWLCKVQFLKSSVSTVNWMPMALLGALIQFGFIS